MSKTRRTIIAMLRTYYHKYVEPLEKEYDDLLDKYNKLKITSIQLNDEYKKAKKTIKELKEKVGYLDSIKMSDDDVKYRDIAKDLSRKLKEKEKLVSRQKIEIERKDKQIEAYKTALLKRGDNNG